LTLNYDSYIRLCNKYIFQNQFIAQPVKLPIKTRIDMRNLISYSFKRNYEDEPPYFMLKLYFTNETNNNGEITLELYGDDSIPTTKPLNVQIVYRTNFSSESPPDAFSCSNFIDIEKLAQQLKTRLLTLSEGHRQSGGDTYDNSDKVGEAISILNSAINAATKRNSNVRSIISSVLAHISKALPAQHCEELDNLNSDRTSTYHGVPSNTNLRFWSREDTSLPELYDVIRSTRHTANLK
jgi:hypothetical protein